MPFLIFGETCEICTWKFNKGKNLIIAALKSLKQWIFLRKKVTKPALYLTSLVFSVCFPFHYYILIIFCIIYMLQLKHWAILENNHTCTMHSVLEFLGQGGSLNWRSEGMGILTVGFPKAWGQTRVWKQWQQCRRPQKAGQKTSINWSSMYMCSGSFTGEN